MYTIHVTNIDGAAKAPELMDLFRVFGEVKRVVVVDGVDPRFALVHMTHEYEAQAAVIATDGYPVFERPLKVEAYFD